MNSIVTTDNSPRMSKAIECDERITYLNLAIRAAFIELGKNLYEMQEKGYFRTFGYSSFVDYADSPEIDLTYRTAKRLINVYKEFVIKRGYDTVTLKNCHYSKLELIRPYLTDENADQLVELSRTLTRDDLEKYLKELRGIPIKPDIFWERIAEGLYNKKMGAKAEYLDAKKRMTNWRNR